MSHILSLETSTEVCAVALYQVDHLIAEERLHTEKAHSKSLASLVAKLLESQGLTPRQLDAVAISSGPGSYTGLRIGTSFAKGLCFSLDIPLIAVPTLSGMLATVEMEEAAYCPMIDARRMEVYCRVENFEGRTLLDTQAMIIDGASFQEILEAQPVYFFGNGAGKCKEVLTHSQARFIDTFEMSALGVGTVAFRKFEQKEFEDMAYFEPFYLKEYKAGEPKSLING